MPIFAPLPGALSALTAKALNSLIELFPVPPFLLPIYEAAGNDYGVPWPVLAAINEIETDYGHNLSISSAGAVGWMQFLPSTWARYGLDADGRGKANPYDPIDAIFSAARYLHTAGAGRNLRGAIFAYNHAEWYVNSVVLRATLLQLMPGGMIDGLMGLMEASFPVAGHLGPAATGAPVLVRVGGEPAATVDAPAGTPVIAVADGRVVGIGRNPALGRYLTLEDSYGNRFTYSRLGGVEPVYPVLKPRQESAVRSARELAVLPERSSGRRIAAAGDLPASRGSSDTTSSSADPASGSTGSTQSRRGGGSASPPIGTSLTSAHVPSGRQEATATIAGAASPKSSTPQPPTMVKERLFADPLRPASYSAGGWIQLQASAASYALALGVGLSPRGPADYFSEPTRFRPRDFALAALRRGSTVVAGTVLGHVAPTRAGATGILLQVRPAGAAKPIDPSAIIAGWELLGRLTAGHDALVGTGTSGAYGTPNATLGQLLQATKRDLQRAVLSDRSVTVYACGRDDIAAGRVDRRVLAVIEYLSYSGLAPSISGLVSGDVCGEPRTPSAESGMQLKISAFDGTPVLGHQNDGGIIDLAIRQLMRLQGALHPSTIVSLRSYPWQPTALAQSDHQAEVEVDYQPASTAIPQPWPGHLDSAQWRTLTARLTQLTDPTSPATAPNKAGTLP